MPSRRARTKVWWVPRMGREWKTWQLSSPADEGNLSAEAATDPVSSPPAQQKASADEPLGCHCTAEGVGRRAAGGH